MSGYDKVEQPGDRVTEIIFIVIAAVYTILFGAAVVVSISNLMLRIGCVQ